MNIFDFHKELIEKYKSYIQSFLYIKDPFIREFVEKELLSNRFWPEPLVQFNPTFEKAQPLAYYVDQGLLHPELGSIFKGFNLYRHQIEAIEQGVKGNEFVVTSGTGSGKSLTYIATIFDYILKQEPSPQGKILAIIVYPMNALINSQRQELEKFKSRYEDNFGRAFPISYAQYTGQENETQRNEIRENPPHILLTNYMMLELLMTRGAKDLEIRRNFLTNLRFLVFDELHTYRGRQGADVAMLIRRVKAAAQNSILCIGTSATMVADECSSLREQKEKVAEVASAIFGSSLKAEQVVSEYLVRSIGTTGYKPNGRELRLALEKKIDTSAPPEDFEKCPVAVWLEEEIALETKEKEEILVRRKPQTLTQIADQLAAVANFAPAQTKAYLEDLLAWANKLNSREKKEKNYLPYKIHQFITQTGSVYATLGDQKSRKLTLEPGLYYDKETPLFPLVFSRYSGHEFYCVRLDSEKQKLIPRSFDDFFAAAEEEEEKDGVIGYLLFEHLDDEETIWSRERDIPQLPDTWFSVSRKNPTPQLKKEKEKLLPQTLYFQKDGKYSFTEGLEFSGYFLPEPLILDPTAGMLYDGKVKEWTKLAKLGGEGISTATTVLAFEILITMAAQNEDKYKQKLLSFTDNRQDASLQAGHFNDFIQNGQLRAAIAQTLQRKNKGLDYANIAEEVLKTLELKEEQYARTPAILPNLRKENEEALKDYLRYQILQDLQRSWRVVLPNLEQCALLQIAYKDLEEAAVQEEYWQDPGNKYNILARMPAKERLEMLRQIFDYFRRSYALSFYQLQSSELNTNANRIREKLKSPWTLEDGENLVEPCFMTIEKLDSTSNLKLKTESAGSRTYLGRYLTKVARRYGIEVAANYEEFAYSFFNSLARLGWLKAQETLSAKGEKIYAYQLNVNTLLWLPGDKQTVIPDLIRTRAYKDAPKLRPNYYFQKFYQTPFQSLKPIMGSEHTGQISSDDRKVREEKFRSGEISALFCSPTMELGIDIADLSIVHLRNVPPSPANYAQRSGRAGRSGQAALVLVFCANNRPHDRYYFNNPAQMVAGTVAPPTIDLLNPELLVSHLYAVVFSHKNINANSLRDWLDEKSPDLPLLPETQEALRLSETEKQNILTHFLKVIGDSYFETRRQKRNYVWFSQDWVKQNVENFAIAFDKALDRWRKLYQSALAQIREANQIIENSVYDPSHEKRIEACRSQQLAVRQIDLLLNQAENGGSAISEFYPFRYLASEGVLPGYNFTLLPLRAFLENKDSGGEYVSRPRAIAISEFGPHNIVYHNGAKYKIQRLMCAEAEFRLEKAKICPDSGYFLYKEEYIFETDPILNKPLKLDPKEHIHHDLLEMTETRALQVERITCQEEERTRWGYDIQTFFAVEGKREQTQKARVILEEEQLLHIHYFPACRIFQLNSRFRVSRDKGFALNLQTGYFPSKEKIEKNDKKSNIRKIKLFTSYTDNALYIQPINALPLQGGRAGVITFMFALERAIEIFFKVESNEISSTIIGNPLAPNILVYESAEGSLGVLSQIMDDPENFGKIIEEAYRLCFYEKGKELPEPVIPATYNDLLSYYNQLYHYEINRNFIREALKLLQNARLEILAQAQSASYQEQYAYLQKIRDPNSSTEEKFLAYLYQNGLRLPDAAQPEIPNMFVRPDFLYNPNILVFCDGTPHDDPAVQNDDRKKRKALKNAGYQILTWYYQDSLEEFIAQRPDIFKKVK
jgi:superfamily II DNA/RNA helicase